MKSFLRTVGAFVVAIVLIFAVLVVMKQNKEASKPPMPVEVKYRKAFLNASLVVSFQNNSTRNLQILTTFMNPTTNVSKSFTASLDPQRSAEMGYAQGWAFHSGDKIKLHHADYADMNVDLP